MSFSMPLPSCLGPTTDRRLFLRAGLGGLLSLAIPRWQALAAASEAHPPAKSCILLWMNGGPSHLETFDPKPGRKVAGPGKAIPTRLKGVQFGEHLPQVAELADRLATLRGMTSKEGNHERAQYLLHTGYAPTGTLRHPGLGAWVSHELGDPRFALPNYVSIRGPGAGAAFLGVDHNPFVVQNPSRPVRDLAYAPDVDAVRFDHRLQALEILQQDLRAKTGDARVTDHSSVTGRAVRMMRSPLCKAFELGGEPDAVKKAYGDSDFGRGCLMARRLIEAGVKFVEVVLDGWDTHQDNFTRTKTLLGQVDPALATLLQELAARRLFDNTLVIWMGEFGRTPAITATEGRDHHPAAWNAVLAGGGVRVGQVYGTTDQDGEKVVDQPLTIPDYFATLATLLGMDPDKEVMTPVGRPINLTNSGKPVPALMRQA